MSSSIPAVFAIPSLAVASASAIPHSLRIQLLLTAKARAIRVFAVKPHITPFLVLFDTTLAQQHIFAFGRE